MSYGLGAYKKTAIHTASKEQVLLMLYQAAIKNCKKAIEAIESNNIPKKGEYIGRLQDIVIELNNSLDFNLRRLSNVFSENGDRETAKIKRAHLRKAKTKAPQLNRF